MKLVILGADGYLGWPTAMYMSARGHDVIAVDNGIKRRMEAELGVEPLVAVAPLAERAKCWNELTRSTIKVVEGDIATDPTLLAAICSKERPEAFVHYAEQPSAPYSMRGLDECLLTHHNNVDGTLNLMFAVHDYVPDAHIVKLGTMGEYGTPNIDIEEGWLNVSHNGRTDRMLYPKKPHSFYHLTKVHDSHNLEFGCRMWKMRVTDLNQGVVYGFDTEETLLDPILNTSFHYDDVFGTVLNRFVVQALCGYPLSVYGKGGQTRGYLNIKDTMRCVELALLNPAERGEFRVFNQFTEQFSVQDLAELVQRAAAMKGLQIYLGYVENPRNEMENHYYNAVHTGLVDLGLEPHLLTEEVVGAMLDVASRHRERIRESTIPPRTTWERGAAERLAPSLAAEIETIEARALHGNGVAAPTLRK
ncbi:MAG: NAD-dependent epimerase/dehydratase family protein [Candidatus Eremiobacteraeota bacterium]|nr:NAD-dependent epimerase/dehydratase family protein [Candidatus Eremiobacteraeota bacterium]